MNTSNTGSPVKRLKAANSRMMVPAHAVQVSVSVPVLVSGPQTPYFKFTCQARKKQNNTQSIFKATFRLQDTANEN